MAEDTHTVVSEDCCPCCGSKVGLRLTITFLGPPEPREPGDLPPDADQGRDDPPEGFR